MYVCVCSFRYLTCKAHAPFCHLWPVRLYNIFSHYLTNGTIFIKKVIEYKRRLTFSTTFPETPQILRITKWNMIKMYIGLHVKFPLFLSDFKQTWFLSTDFRKIIGYQISCQSFQWEPSWSMRTDRHNEANSGFLRFCERAWKGKNEFSKSSLPKMDVFWIQRLLNW